MHKYGQTTQISNYKMSKFWESDVQHGGSSSQSQAAQLTGAEILMFSSHTHIFFML